MTSTKSLLFPWKGPKAQHASVDDSVPRDALLRVTEEPAWLGIRNQRIVLLLVTLSLLPWVLLYAASWVRDGDPSSLGDQLYTSGGAWALWVLLGWTAVVVAATAVTLALALVVPAVWERRFLARWRDHVQLGRKAWEQRDAEFVAMARLMVHGASEEERQLGTAGLLAMSSTDPK